LLVDNNKVREIVKQFNSQNGNQAFTLKDLIIYFNTEQSERTKNIEDKLDEHIKIEDTNKGQIWKSISEHDKIIQHIVDEMPEKGFCNKTQNVLNCWQPNKHEPPLDKKVETLWYDRKLLKWLIGTLIISIIASFGSILVHFAIP